MTDKVPESPKKVEEPTDELPEVDEATIGELSEEVCRAISFSHTFADKSRPGTPMRPS